MQTTFSSRMRAARHAAGMTQKSLASESMIAKTTIGRLELGKAKPDFHQAQKIARVLGICSFELLDGEPPQFNRNHWGYREKHARRRG